MEAQKFWSWRTDNSGGVNNNSEGEERTLFLEGTISSSTWYDDDLTPAMFKEELESGSGDITVWINSPGGDCFAAAQIYNMLREYKGKVTVKVDGLAASAASVVAMAGDEVLVSPVSMMMIHNPATVAAGDHVEMERTIAMLDEVKNSIINAYQTKTGLSRQKLSQLMDDETWMNARKAVELRFADGILEREQQAQEGIEPAAMAFSRRPFVQQVMNRIQEHCRAEEPEPTDQVNHTTEPGPGNQTDITREAQEPEATINAADLYERLRTIKDNF